MQHEAATSEVPASPASAGGPAGSLLASARTLAPGLLASLALAAAAMLAGGRPWAQAHALTPLALAIVAGMVAGNLLPAASGAAIAPGVGTAKQTLLRLGVILYGFRLTLSDIGRIGLHGVLADAVMLASTAVIAWFAGTQLLGVERRTALLIGAGSSVCGAAAVLATGPVVRGEPRHVAAAMGTVLVFGSAAMFLYPALYQLNQHWHLLPEDHACFGIYAGSTIHEVAQVFAAVRPLGQEVADMAVITKMVRVMMLAPFLLCLSLLVRMDGGPVCDGGSACRTRWHRSVPWFALGFVAAVAANSALRLPAPLLQRLLQADTLLLAMAMGALGLSTSLAAIRGAGLPPMLLGGLLFVWLIAGGALVNRWI